MFDDFRKFLTDNKIISMAVAFMIAIAARDLIDKFFQDLISPFLYATFSYTGGTLQNVKIYSGPIPIYIGDFLYYLANFLILAFFIYLLVGVEIKEEKKERRKRS